MYRKTFSHGPFFDIQWDPVKAASNFAKHGVSFDEARVVQGFKKGAPLPNQRPAAVRKEFRV